MKKEQNLFFKVRKFMCPFCVQTFAIMNSPLASTLISNPCTEIRIVNILDLFKVRQTFLYKIQQFEILFSKQFSILPKESSIIMYSKFSRFCKKKTREFAFMLISFLDKDKVSFHDAALLVSLAQDHTFYFNTFQHSVPSYQSNAQNS